MTTRSIQFLVLAAVAVAWSKLQSAEPIKHSVDDQGLDADVYTTVDSKKKVGVVALGGSEGGKQPHLAKPFADAGYSTMALAYFKTKTTPEDLCEIPLEYFTKAINWMQANEKVPGGIVVAGGSKGAELALLLGAKHPEIKGVI